jgi:Pvc16 N-terminal domain
MLKDLLQFLADELNKYLIQKGEVVSTDSPRVVLGNVAKVFDNEPPPSGAEAISNNAIISVVNIEEDRVSKQQENYVKAVNTVKYKSPPLYLNIYVLIAVNRNNYGTSLGWLSHIIQFFQYQSVFTPLTHPALNSKINKLIVDLYSLNFEQINHLWSTLGGKYLPSVMYKIRQVTLDEDLMISESGFIREIRLDEKVKQPVTE